MFDDDYERALLAFSSASHDASDAHDDGAGPAVDTARQRLPQSPGRTPGKANVHTFLDVIKRGGEAQGQGCQGEGQDAADTEALSPMRQLFLDELTSLDGNLSDSSEEPLPPLPPPSNDTYEAVMTTITTPSFNPLQPFTVPLTRDHGPVGYGFSVVMEVSSPGMIKNMIVHKVNDAGPAARAGKNQLYPAASPAPRLIQLSHAAVACLLAVLACERTGV